MEREKNEKEKEKKERAQNILCVFDVCYTNLSLSAYADNNVAHIILFVCAEFFSFFSFLLFVNFMNTQ